MSDVTRILSQIESGDPASADQLLPLVYDELRSLAAAKLAHEQPGQTLSATALVHEAYLRLAGPAGLAGGDSGDIAQGEFRPVGTSWHSRGHFFAAAAEAMRRILVDAARSRRRLKRGGEATREEFCEGLLASDAPTDELLAIHDALDRLEGHDSLAAQLVKLRYFVGMQHQEAADSLGISRRTADGLWALARAWLRRELKS